MSTCPSKDLLNVYLDDELPQVFVKELESHVEACTECQKYLASLRAVKSAMAVHSNSLSPDTHYLDQSFERLQTKMKYTKNSGRVIRGRWPSSRVIGAVAAAAVFALVLPVGINLAKPSAGTSAVESTLPPALANNVSNVSSNKGVLLSGNISPEIVSATNVSTKGAGYSRQEKNLIKDVDVFRPNFDNGSTISIKITMPGMDATPVTTEVQLPLASVMGFFE